MPSSPLVRSRRSCGESVWNIKPFDDKSCTRPFPLSSTRLFTLLRCRNLRERRYGTPLCVRQEDPVKIFASNKRSQRRFLLSIGFWLETMSDRFPLMVVRRFGRISYFRMNEILAPAGKLLAFCRACFEKLGLSPQNARLTAENLIFANLRGVDSHGV